VAQDCDNLHQASKRDNDSLKISSHSKATAKAPKKFTPRKPISTACDELKVST
jgi:hypothetical protein